MADARARLVADELLDRGLKVDGSLKQQRTSKPTDSLRGGGQIMSRGVRSGGALCVYPNHDAYACDSSEALKVTWQEEIMLDLPRGEIAPLKTVVKEGKSRETGSNLGEVPLQVDRKSSAEIDRWYPLTPTAECSQPQGRSHVETRVISE